MNNWEKIIREKMEGFEQILPDGDWDIVKGKLDDTEKSGRKVILKTAITALAAIAASLFFVIILKHSTFKEDQLSTHNSIQNTLHQERLRDQSVVTGPVLSSASTIEDNNANETIESLTDSLSTVLMVEIPDSTWSEDYEQDHSYPHFNNLQDGKEQSIQNGAFGTGETQERIIRRSPSFSISTIYAGQNSLNIWNEARYGSSPRTLPYLDDDPVSITHFKPLEIGIALRIPISDRLMISSGLEYSKYQTEIVLPSRKEMLQTVKYLGIPLQFQFTFVHSGRLSVYAGTGVKADWNIGTTIGENNMDTERASYSLLFSGGAHYSINNQLGVYLEPRASYYLPGNHPTYSTYRTEKGISTELSLGLTFSL